jgi:uncharacterized protein DUF6885
MTELHASLLPGATRLAALHAAALPQKESLCGPFWGALALQAAGAGAALDQDAVALAAGTTLGMEDEPAYRPPDAVPRVDYRLDLPRIEDESRTGTSAPGLARAIERLSDGALAVVPVQGDWSPERLLATFDAIEALPGPVTPIANVATGHFWHSRAPFAQALRYLDDGDDAGADAEWQVGHFVGLLGRVRGPRGTLVLVADTYPELGERGVHRQPVERVARALQRVDMTRGGLLVALPARAAPAFADAVRAAGLEVGPWDNGSDDVAEDADAR